MSLLAARWIAVLACVVWAGPALALGLLLSGAPGGSGGPPRPPDNRLRILDPAEGATQYTQAEVTLGGQPVDGVTGLARHPDGGKVYGFLKLSGATASVLARIDESTGAATSIGSTGQRMSAMAFASDGTLYAASGNMSIISHGLFTVDLVTGQSSLIGTLDNGSDDGEALAFNPDDGLLYHAKGLGNRNNNNGEIFEKFDPATCTGSPKFDCDFISVTLSGDDYEEITALVYVDGGFYAADVGNLVDDPHLYRMTPGGAVTLLGPMDHVSKGLVPFSPPLPALQAPLLGLLTAALGILGASLATWARPATRS